MENAKYILGDLVKDKYQSNEIFKVTDTSKHGYILKSIENDVIVNATAETIAGIPLTPQILEANGWEKVHQEPVNCCNKYRKFRNVDLTYNIQTKTFFFEIFNIAGAVVVRLPYVHTLQHLLFGLGLPSELKV